MDCNFIAMSSAGKPVYARHGDDNEIGRICGLVHAVRSTIGSLDNSSVGGDIRSLRSGKLCIVFMPAGELVFLAIGIEADTEAYLRLQLEYIYSHVLFTLTERVHDYFAYDPGFDLRSVLGSADANIIDSILDESFPQGNPGPILLGSIETLFPISPAIRARASRALKVAGLKADFTAFAMLVAGDKLITLIQPSVVKYQLRIADLHLLLKAVNRQPHLLSSELWIPICLPLFSSKDFLYCYTQCWDEDSKLCLILMSQQGTTEQFQIFQEAATNIRRSLDLPATAESSILEILDNSTNQDDVDNQQGSGQKDVKWRRSAEDKSFDQDYVEISYGELDRIMPYLPSPPCPSSSTFLREVRSACYPHRMQQHLEHYLSIGSAIHFAFRFEVAMLGQGRNQQGRVPQFIGSQLGFPFLDSDSQRIVWSNYQKLRLRLCIGSSTSESTMQAWDKMSTAQTPNIQTDSETAANETSQSKFLGIGLATLSPNSSERMAFVMDKTELYLAMKGKDYEFYTVVSGSTSLKEATTAASKLVRRLFADQRSLFLYHPLSWDG